MATADTMEKYAYKAPTTSTTVPQVYDSFQRIASSGETPMPTELYKQFVLNYSPEELAKMDASYGGRLSAVGNAFSNVFAAGDGGMPPTTYPTGGSGSAAANARNAAQILLQLRSRDPYAGLRSALERNAAAARQTGDSAVAALRAALEARQNPYANVQFSTPMAASNPLAEYMAQSGAGTGQIDALRNLLQSWSADAAAADQQMANRLSTSWQNDQTSRLSDAATTEAAFKQALASSLASQQGALDSQYAQYQADLTQRLAELAMSSGVSLKDLGVTL